MLGSQIPLYQQMGRTQVNVHANIDVGGYAWGRYGFVPNQPDWDHLRQRASSALDGVRGQLPAEDYNVVSAALASKDPKSMWKAVDNRSPIQYEDGTTQPLGKHLFLGSKLAWYT